MSTMYFEINTEKYITLVKIVNMETRLIYRIIILFNQYMCFVIIRRVTLD